VTEVSTKPYIIRAIYEWCVDCGYTPYIAVAVDDRTQVPREFVKNGEIVLNISPTAINQLDLGNEWIDFQARFGGRARNLSVPVDNVTAIYSRETGHGMAFDLPLSLAQTSAGEQENTSASSNTFKVKDHNDALFESAISKLDSDSTSLVTDGDFPETGPSKSDTSAAKDKKSLKRSKNHLVRVK
jgi:stringent starvation protein B